MASGIHFKSLRLVDFSLASLKTHLTSVVAVLFQIISGNGCFHPLGSWGANKCKIGNEKGGNRLFYRNSELNTFDGRSDYKLSYNGLVGP